MFQYQPLTAVDAFRLVVLEAGDSKDVIRCRLVDASHSDNLDYEALSYTWGDPSPCSEIILDRNIISVRQNLWHAFYYLRSPFEDRMLWVDAVCIDQTSTSERNHQVRQMKNIYRRASTVIVWLGLPSQSSKTAIDWIEDFSPRQRGALGIKERLDCVTASEITQNQAARWHALQQLCSQEYWQRVWIVQEVVLADRIIIQCGNDTARWTGLENLIQDYDVMYKPRAALECPNAFLKSLPVKLHQLRKLHRGSSGCRLGALMSMTKSSKCSDVRDKVYGLLGLAEDPNADGIPIDYSSDSKSLYSSLWKFYVTNRPAYSRIAGCQILNRTTKGTELDGVGCSDLLTDFLAVGRLVGSIGYVGQPWRDDEDMKRLEAIMNDFQARDFPVETQWQTFMNTLHTITAEEMGGIGLCSYGKTLLRTNTNNGEGAKKPISAKAVFDDASPASPRSRFAMPTSHRTSLSLLPPDKYLFVASNGQVGIVPYGVRMGDAICQFQSCDVTAVVVQAAQPPQSQRGDWMTAPRRRATVAVVGAQTKWELFARGLMARRWNEKPTYLNEGFAETFKFSVLDGRVFRNRQRLSDRMDDKIIHLSIEGMDVRWLTQ